MRSILICSFLMIASLASAQKLKVTLNDDTILVNGDKYAIIEKSGGLSFNFRIRSLDGKDLIQFQFQEFNNPKKANSANPNGRITYFEVTFLGSGAKCEVGSPGTKKGVAKIVAENKLVKDNAVDPEAEKNFVMINGSKFSEEKQSLSGPKVIIIEK